MVVYKVITNWDFGNSPRRSSVKLVEENHDSLPDNFADNRSGYYEEYYESREAALKTCLANQREAQRNGDIFTPIGW